MLPRISAELADHVRGRTDSAHLLRCVAHENLFLVGLDEEGEWFRYHALFAEYLQTRVADGGRLRVRAAEWFRDHDQIEDAVELAIAADDQALVASLLEEHHLELSRSGRSTTVDRWIAALPRDLLTARPGVLAAGVLAASGSAIERDAARRLLALAGLAKTADPARWTPVPRGRTAAVERAHGRRLRARRGGGRRAGARARAHARARVGSPGDGRPRLHAGAARDDAGGRRPGRRRAHRTFAPATARTGRSGRWPRARSSPPASAARPSPTRWPGARCSRPPAPTSPPTSRPPSPTSRPPRPRSSTVTRRARSAGCAARWRSGRRSRAARCTRG